MIIEERGKEEKSRGERESREARGGEGRFEPRVREEKGWFAGGYFFSYFQEKHPRIILHNSVSLNILLSDARNTI